MAATMRGEGGDEDEGDVLQKPHHLHPRFLSELI